MLDQETKRKIDNSRDILVGKVPDPKSQVEQITIALIYKFMDDMDKESIALGGKAAFFKGEYEKYTWSRIFDPKLGGFELIKLYSEAITTMNHNENIPQLFRDIFKNAFLPYRDPETLKSFLKEINEFKYDHSEKLGDAFEYLLSVLGSQGDAGQFRTPRHIIDFIVSVVDPKKNESILDPACGTAGFLISSFKHILSQNTKERKGDCLTMDERKKLMNNLVGYDISPDMVRLSLVNMYLHGFQTPKIHEYDTLTSEERWNESYDVILANPPFMTPKGGIRPHKRFSVQANRSEVLFVDYIMEHLTINGRAGVIVPEGIIFQSANAYKALRKLLVDTHLFAVVSLPSGVFQPYAGVKTSILLMDRTLAKRAQDILFVKIESDGFDLGAQRRPNDKSDLTMAFSALLKFRRSIYEGKEWEFIEEESKIAHRVLKTKIAENGDYNLSGERYKEVAARSKKGWELIELGNVILFVSSGSTPLGGKENYADKGILFIRSQNILKGECDFSDAVYISPETHSNMKRSQVKKFDVFLNITGASIGRSALMVENVEANVNQHVAIIRVNNEKLSPLFLVSLLNSDIFQKKINGVQSGASRQALNYDQIRKLNIPLPPLSVQQEIVAEIEGYQKIIDGARQVVENYKPRIKMDEGWKVVELDEICSKITDGSHYSPPTNDKGYPYITVKDVQDDKIDFDNCRFIDEVNYLKLVKDGCRPENNDVLFSKDGTVGKVSLVDFDKEFAVLSSLAIIRPNINIIIPKFLKYILKDENILNQAIGLKTGSALKRIILVNIKKINIPLPPLDVQKEIVARIEEEQKLVDANKKLIELFEGKIKEKIAEVWG